MTWEAFKDSKVGADAMKQCEQGGWWLALELAFKAGQGRVYAPVEPARDGEPFVPAPLPMPDALPMWRKGT